MPRTDSYYQIASFLLFKVIIKLQHFSLPFSFSKLSYIPFLVLFLVQGPLSTNCYCMYLCMCICMYIHIVNYNWLSLYNVACMYVFVLAISPTRSPTGVYLLGETLSSSLHSLIVCSFLCRVELGGLPHPLGHAYYCRSCFAHVKTIMPLRLFVCIDSCYLLIRHKTGKMGMDRQILICMFH